MGDAWIGPMALAMLSIAARPACCDSAKPLAPVAGGAKPGAYAGMRNPLLGCPLTWWSCPFAGWPPGWAGPLSW
jgi:hypothetical protein